MKNNNEVSNNISLIYALGLGINKSLKDKGNLGLTDNETDFYSNNNWFLWYMVFANNKDNSLTKNIDQSWAGSGGAGGSFTGSGFTDGGTGGI